MSKLELIPHLNLIIVIMSSTFLVGSRRHECNRKGFERSPISQPVAKNSPLKFERDSISHRIL